MDYIRICYLTVMKLWRDSDTLYPVRWFRASAGAKVFGGVSSLRSRFVWCKYQGWEPGTVGEQDRQYTYDKGENNLAFTGEHTCGSEEAGRVGGTSGQPDQVQVFAGGATPCCSTDCQTPFGPVSDVLRLRVESVLGFCPCLHGASTTLHCVGPAAWRNGELADPPPPFGTCTYTQLGRTYRTGIRAGLAVVTGTSSDGWYLRFTLTLTSGPGEPEGQPVDFNVPLDVTSLRPFRATGGIAWRAISTPGCGIGFGSNPQAFLRIFVDGPPLP